VPQELKRPIELAALKGRLERAQRVHGRIADTGKRYDKVLDAIEEKEAQAASHVGYLEQYDQALGQTIKEMIGGSNFPPEGADGPHIATNGSGEALEPAATSKPDVASTIAANEGRTG